MSALSLAAVVCTSQSVFYTPKCVCNRLKNAPPPQTRHPHRIPEPVVEPRNRDGSQFLETLLEAWSKPCLKPQTTPGLAVLL